jgi:hypothetical protein
MPEAVLNNVVEWTVSELLAAPQSIAQIRLLLREIEDSALNGASLTELHARLGPLLIGYPTATMRISGPIYRGRKLKGSIFSNISDLWYPPDGVVSQGRVNEVGKPIFYCSDHHFTVTREMAPHVGDTIAILQCELKEKSGLPEVFCIGNAKGILRHGTDAFGKKVAPSVDLRKFPQRMREHSALIDGFFSRVFKSTGSSYFNLTNAISQQYLGSFWIDGLAYPSVQPGGSMNMALKTAAVDRLYTPKSVFLTKTEKIFGANKLKMRCVGTANIRSDGILEWSFGRHR